MRKLTLLICSLALSGGMYARTISLDEATQIAAGFASTTAPAMRVKAKAPAMQPVLVHTERADGQDLFYVFNRPGRGFVIVAADDNARTVLAYSDTNELTSIDAVPDNMRAWLGEYARQILAAKAAGAAAAPLRVARQQVSPLLTSKWNQGEPYNGDCPEVNLAEGGTGRAVSGCVGTAMAEVMHYYRYPAAPRGDTHYVWNHTDKSLVENVTRNFSGHTYDWDNMLDDYTVGNVTDAQRSAVAVLMADAAYSVEMQFSETSSAASTQLVPFAMATYFDYDASAICEERDFHDAAEWENLICDELDARRPVIYTGKTESGSAHTWVIDGTDGNGMYHINWGWGGFENGYFALTGANILAPETGGIGGASIKESFHLDQAAILGLKPNAGGEPRIDFVSMKGETLNVTTLERPIATPATYEDLWVNLNGEFLNHSNRGNDRYCDFGLRLTNTATGESLTVAMPLEAPVLMQSLTMIGAISVLKQELQFLPSGTYDVEAVFRDYTAKVTGGGMEYIGDGEWKTFRHLHGQPAAQKLLLTGTVPDLYISEAVETVSTASDHLAFKATFHANAAIDGYIVPLLFEAVEINPATGQPSSWQANMQRQALPNVPLQMAAGETKTVYLGEWPYDVADSELPAVLMLQLTFADSATAAWNPNNVIAPTYNNQAMFTPTPATAITGVSAAKPLSTEVFTLGGQRVGRNVGALKPGLYIVGGKKVLVK